MVCENLKRELEVLEQWVDRLQRDLYQATPSEKPGTIREIRKLNREIHGKKTEYENCLIENNVQPLSVTFTGTSTLTTSYESARGPFNNTLRLGLYFGSGRTSVWLNDFPPITTEPFSTPVGTNFTTVSLTRSGRGLFYKSSGAMSINLTLRFDHSIDFPFYEEDSTLPLLLGTGSVGTLNGAPLNRETKRLVLVGIGIFEGGILNGNTGRLVIDGTISNLP